MLSIPAVTSACRCIYYAAAADADIIILILLAYR